MTDELRPGEPIQPSDPAPAGGKGPTAPPTDADKETDTKVNERANEGKGAT